MNVHDVNALVLEPGASMTYFSGINWWRSERLTSVIVPREGKVVVICPAFEKPSIQESLKIEADIHIWEEHESPFQLAGRLLKNAQFVIQNGYLFNQTELQQLKKEALEHSNWLQTLARQLQFLFFG